MVKRPKVNMISGPRRSRRIGRRIRLMPVRIAAAIVSAMKSPLKENPLMK